MPEQPATMVILHCVPGEIGGDDGLDPLHDRVADFARVAAAHDVPAGDPAPS